MTELTPVPWEGVEAAAGPTATELEESVAKLTSEPSEGDREAFETVKTVYDEWKADRGEEHALSDQAAAFVVASLLEREGVVDVSDAPQGSLVERRPSAERNPSDETPCRDRTRRMSRNTRQPRYLSSLCQTGGRTLKYDGCDSQSRIGT